MSRRSKVVLGLSVLLTAATVTGVHLKQRQDRQVGVPGPRGSGLGPSSVWRLISSPFLPPPGPGTPPSPALGRNGPGGEGVVPGYTGLRDAPHPGPRPAGVGAREADSSRCVSQLPRLPFPSGSA